MNKEKQPYAFIHEDSEYGVIRITPSFEDLAEHVKNGIDANAYVNGGVKQNFYKLYPDGSKENVFFDQYLGSGQFFTEEVRQEKFNNLKKGRESWNNVVKSWNDKLDKGESLSITGSFTLPEMRNDRFVVKEIDESQIWKWVDEESEKNQYYWKD